MDKRLAQGSRPRSTSSSARNMMASPKMDPIPLLSPPPHSQNLFLHPSPNLPPSSSYPTPIAAAGSSEAKPVACTRSPPHQEPQLQKTPSFFSSNPPPPDPPPQPPWLGHNYNAMTQTTQPSPDAPPPKHCCPTRSPYYSFPPHHSSSPPHLNESWIKIYVKQECLFDSGQNDKS